jgi:hypothetical protein
MDAHLPLGINYFYLNDPVFSHNEKELKLTSDYLDLFKKNKIILPLKINDKKLLINLGSEECKEVKINDTTGSLQLPGKCYKNSTDNDKSYYTSGNLNKSVNGNDIFECAERGI